MFVDYPISVFRRCKTLGTLDSAAAVRFVSAANVCRDRHGRARELVPAVAVYLLCLHVVLSTYLHVGIYLPKIM